MDRLPGSIRLKLTVSTAVLLVFIIGVLLGAEQLVAQGFLSRQKLYVVGGILLLLGVSGAFLFSRRFTRPLIELPEQVQQAASTKIGRGITIAVEY